MNHKKTTVSCAVIIVTHNSQKFLKLCLESLQAQTLLPEQILIVDSCSASSDYLKEFENVNSVQIIYSRTNIGFCSGNNLGYSLVLPHIEFVLFLNPDAFLTPTFIQKSLKFLSNPIHANVGALTGLLKGYDIQKQKPTGRIDSTGIVQKWYGKWLDRDQGKLCEKVSYRIPEEAKAICGALFFCRRKALESVKMDNFWIFDPSFYMYKEDIDLSLRLKNKGWVLIFHPELSASHCRGWQNDRSKMPRKFRLLSAKNEIKLYKRMYSPKILYSLLKFFCVKLFNI